MSIHGPEELAGMRAAGAVVRRTLEAMKQAVRPGITTAELDGIGAKVMHQHGAQSAPALVNKFLGVNCISVNEEVVHGVPGERKILTEGLVITVEPIIAAGSGRAVVAKDGWTVRTADRKTSAHYEHTLVITKGEPILLTAA